MRIARIDSRQRVGAQCEVGHCDARWPVDEICADPNSVAPSWKLTEPVVVMVPSACGVTLAVNVTGVPTAIVSAVERTSVVAVATCVAISGIVADVLVRKFASPG